MELKKPIEVILWSYKGKISSISWRKKLEPWHREDRILVWIDLDKPVDGTSGFGIAIPVKDYTKDEFLAAVYQEGEERLKEILSREKAARENREIAKERERELETITLNIIQRLS